MDTTVLEPDAAVIDDRIVEGVRIRVAGDEIIEVGAFETEVPTRRIAGTLLPGVIDLQCNGAGGHSVDEATPDALDAVARQVAAGGAAAFLPTLISCPFDDLLEQIAAVARWIRGQHADRATPLGIHLEGPFLEAAGTHDAGCLLDPTPARIDEILAAADGQLSLLTLAPSRRGSAEATARLVEAGVTVSVGHAARADGLGACIDAGARLATHLFNAMGAMHHRAPGLPGHVLDDARLTCTVIPDGVHVHEVMLRNAWRCLGPSRTVLVTDSVAAAGCPDGEYQLAGRPVLAHNGTVRDPEGNLAGSALTMTRAVAGWCAMTGADDAVTLARITSTNPARALGLSRLGRIAPGHRASFSVLDPNRTVRPLPAN